MNKKLILVICALGYATSTMIKRTIEEYLKANNIKDWKVEAVGLNMSAPMVPKANVIVSSLELNPKDYNVPVINGISLISGINKEATLQEILKTIQEV